MLVELEEAIVQRLQSLQDNGVKIIGFPDNPSELGRPFPSGQILVGFKKESLGQPAAVVTTAPIIQPWTIEFELSLQLKNLRSHSGAYPIMETIRDLLSGFRPPMVTRPIYQVQGGFVDLKDGIWFYSMIFACHTTYQKSPF